MLDVIFISCYGLNSRYVFVGYIFIFMEKYLNYIVVGAERIIDFGRCWIISPFSINKVFIMINTYRDVNLYFKVYLSFLIYLSFHFFMFLPFMPLTYNLYVLRWTHNIWWVPVEIHRLWSTWSTMIISTNGA